MAPCSYRYPPGALIKDYATAAIGMGAFGGPSLFVPMPWPLLSLAAILGALFAILAFRTLIRQLSSLSLDDEGIVINGPIRRRLAWKDIAEIRLRFYSTWRDKRSGWMQLNVRGQGATIRIDEAIGGFGRIAEAIFAAADRKGFVVNAVTLQNAKALNIDLPPGWGDGAP